MLEKNFEKIYFAFRAGYYRKLVERMNAREGSLSATEAFSAEIIYLLNKPTISEFADFVGVSQSNATYKINNLIAKGYIKKTVSATDKREFHLEMTDKALDYSGLNNEYIASVVKKAETTFNPEEIALLNRFLEILLDGSMGTRTNI